MLGGLCRGALQGGLPLSWLSPSHPSIEAEQTHAQGEGAPLTSSLSFSLSPVIGVEQTHAQVEGAPLPSSLSFSLSPVIGVEQSLQLDQTRAL